MSKDSDERLQKLEIEIGIEKGISKWKRTICITSTSMFMTLCTWLGSHAYDHFSAIGEGIKAFLSALRNGQ